jgi:hypothetical protein
MLRCLHFLQFSIGYLIGLVFDLQAFQFEYGIDGHKNRVILCANRTGRGFCQSRNWSSTSNAAMKGLFFFKMNAEFSCDEAQLSTRAL